MAFQAVFLDRDGVINQERGRLCKKLEEFQLLPGGAALRQLAQLSIPIGVVTNQSAIGRGRVCSQRPCMTFTNVWPVSSRRKEAVLTPLLSVPTTLMTAALVASRSQGC